MSIMLLSKHCLNYSVKFWLENELNFEVILILRQKIRKLKTLRFAMEEQWYNKVLELTRRFINTACVKVWSCFYLCFGVHLRSYNIRKQSKSWKKAIVDTSWSPTYGWILCNVLHIKSHHSFHTVTRPEPHTFQFLNLLFFNHSGFWLSYIFQTQNWFR